MDRNNHGDIRSTAESIYYSINMIQQQQQQLRHRSENFGLYIVHSNYISFIKYVIVHDDIFLTFEPTERSPMNIDLLHIVTQDYLAGYMDDGRMSVVRRFFTLFVIFDLFFISLLWIICIMVIIQNPNIFNYSNIIINQLRFNFLVNWTNNCRRTENTIAQLFHINIVIWFSDNCILPLCTVSYFLCNIIYKSLVRDICKLLDCVAFYTPAVINISSF